MVWSILLIITPFTSFHAIINAPVQDLFEKTMDLLVKGMLLCKFLFSYPRSFLQGMELYPRIGKHFDIKVFTNCRFGMMSWAVLAVTYCIKQVGAPRISLYTNIKVKYIVSVSMLLSRCVRFKAWHSVGYIN